MSVPKKTEIKNCLNCNKTFHPRCKTNNFCSNSCSAFYREHIKNNRKPLDIEKICREYLNGKSTPILAKEYEYSIPTIQRVLIENGVKLRSVGHDNLKHGFIAEANKLGIHPRKLIWQKAVQKLGGQCIKCGENDIRILQINHIDRIKSKPGETLKLKELINIIEDIYEGDPLDIRCANCNILYEYDRKNRKNDHIINNSLTKEKLIEPKVWHIAGTTLDREDLNKLFDLYNIPLWESSSHSEAEELVEIAGRLCYQSWEPLTFNANVTKIRENSKEYINNILKSKHGSVIEHVSDTFIIHCSRVCANEIVRHRLASYSQESLRYVRLNELKLYYPDSFKNRENLNLKQLFENKINYDEKFIKKLNSILELDSLSFDEKKKLTSAVRRLAPMGIMTYLSMTTNARNWRWIIEMRTNRHAEEEIRKVFSLIFDDLEQRYPYLYQDSRKEIIDGIAEITFENEKV